MRWLRRVLDGLRNTNVVLALAFVLGLVLGEPAAAQTEALTLPALGVLVTVAASDVSLHAFRRWRRVLQATGLAILSTYLIDTGAILLLASLLFTDPQLYTGYVLVAAAPPAASALAFCILLRGDVALSLIGTVGAYLASLVLAPLITLLFARRGLVRVDQLFTTLVQLVVIPLALSRLLRLPRLQPIVRRWRQPVIAWAFALVVFTVVGLNRRVFLGEPGLVLLIAAVAGATTFGVGALVDLGLRRLRVDRRRRVSLVLLSTVKNSGFAAAVALALVSPRASLPGAVVSAVNALFLAWLGVQAGRRRSGLL